MAQMPRGGTGNSLVQFRAVYGPNLQAPRNLTHPLRHHQFQTILRVNHGLMQLAPVPPLQVLTSTFLTLISQRSQDLAPYLCLQ